MARFLATFALLFTSLSLQAQTTVFDPNHLLPQVRSFAGIKSFAETFVCGTSANFKSSVISCDEIRCDDTGCWTMCTETSEPIVANQSVVNCTADAVELFTDATGNLIEIKKADYEAAGSNTAEFFLSDLGRFTSWPQANVYLQEVKPTVFTLARGTPNERKVEALNVMFQLGEQNTLRFDGILTVIKNVPGVAQVGRIRIGGTSFFVLDDLVNGVRTRKGAR